MTNPSSDERNVNDNGSRPAVVGPMIERSVSMYCDRCWGTDLCTGGSVHGETITEVRAKARAEGWTFTKDGQHFCGCQVGEPKPWATEWVR
jgi:uncharacterized protein (UPF0128 family)